MKSTYVRNRYPAICAIVTILLVAPFRFCYADDKEANEAVSEATELLEKENYNSAGKKYLAAELYADTVLLKANSLKHAAACFRKARKLFKEFECIEKLLTSYPDYVNFQKAVHREFEIGNRFFEGHRDAAFSWMPWVKDTDKTIEIYEKALGHGSFSKYAPQAKLRLGRLYINDKKLKKALTTFREVIKLYPGTLEQKYAYFELGNALLQLSEKGDGDGRYGEEASGIFNEILKKYPKDVEKPWAEEAAEKVREVTASRLYGIARYYYRNGNKKTAERYLNEVVKRYYDTEVAFSSEELLTEIDKEFEPEGKPYKEKVFYKFKFEEMPEEPVKLLVVPENSDGKWLLPVEDLGIKESKDPGVETQKEKDSKVEDEFQW